uniref:Mitogen-activated protein kinase kinase kinase 19 n=1 Tax=Oryzias melastigma TaxID=30732 RepID=A0A3B3BYN7_ORYME
DPDRNLQLFWDEPLKHSKDLTSPQKNQRVDPGSSTNTGEGDFIVKENHHSEKSWRACHEGNNKNCTIDLIESKPFKTQDCVQKKDGTSPRHLETSGSSTENRHKDISDNIYITNQRHNQKTETTENVRTYCRLQGEVELLKTLQHINIVGFLGTSLNRHVVSIFMEYIPGGSILGMVFPLLCDKNIFIFQKDSLLVIHRDIKGNNVMLMPTGVIKLIDFGCARRLSCLNSTFSSSVELIKSVHGTPYWMAPEVGLNTFLCYGRKSDVWSVGCTVFEMATGKPPLAHMDKMAGGGEETNIKGKKGGKWEGR